MIAASDSTDVQREPAGFALFVLDRVAGEFGETGTLPVALAAWMLDHDTDGYYKFSRAFVDGEHKLILSSDGRDEAYDLAADPAEARNVVHQAWWVPGLPASRHPARSASAAIR